MRECGSSFLRESACVFMCTSIFCRYPVTGYDPRASHPMPIGGGGSQSLHIFFLCTASGERVILRKIKPIVYQVCRNKPLKPA